MEAVNARSHPSPPNIPLARAWNTWAAGRYLEMSFKPLGVKVTPVVYAASIGKTSMIGPGSEIKLRIHTTDGSHIDARFNHAGTAIDWSYAKPSALDVVGKWKAIKFGEWGLRFWVTLCLSQEDGANWRYDEAHGIASCEIGGRVAWLKAERAPLLVTGHSSVEELCAEYETHGYWYLASRMNEARVLALRFNLEEAKENRFSIAIAERAAFELKNVVIAADPLPVRSGGEALDAIRDVMGWNSIWDDVNHRPYITCSRNWDLKKFGGYGFWLNDTAVNALLVSLFDLEQARENLAMVLGAATAAGNLPCIMTGNDQWLDRSQSPIMAFVVWQIYRMSGDASMIEMAYDVLARNNEWWRRTRDGNGNGILEFGSSDVGRGLYKGTKLAAKDESFMDNSPIHDEARWNEKSRTLDCEDVGLNCLVALDCEMLGLMAGELGLSEAASGHSADAASLRKKTGEHFWDSSRNVFANRLWSGKFTRSVAPTSFYPLLCGGASVEQTRHLLAHLDDPRSFGGEFGLPSVSRDDPAFRDNVYWRGRIWPILNWLTWNGLARAGEHEAANHLAEKGWHLFARSWRERRLCPENYNAETGEGLDQPETDSFYSWSALFPFIKHAQDADLSPWRRS
jgi:Mannosylglycerate hydrolase MGH1-like glycoside hydrolase domain